MHRPRASGGDREGAPTSQREVPPPLPTEPIDRLIAPIERFLHVEAAGGIVLLLSAAVALIIANSSWADTYHHLWRTPIGVEIGPLHLRHTLEHWINDGLMVLFFFVVGLEVKRELVLGELRDPRAAVLPLVAAVGGMVVPAGIYLSVLAGTPAARGWGVPMATDIAFVVGCMAVLGPRVPSGLRVLLLSLAIADDIGAILVIAVGYSTGIAVIPLLLGVAGIGVVVLLQRIGVRSLGVYAVVGVGVWLAVLHSGVHATIAGVALSLVTPAHAYVNRGTFIQFLAQVRQRLRAGTGETPRERVAQVRLLGQTTRETVSPLEYVENALHPWVSFVIMPVFALANAGVHVHFADLGNRIAVAVAVSLLLGKLVGVSLFSWLAVALGVARLPAGVSWTQVAGGGVLCGIGFTMALFVASLALDGPALDAAKVGILSGSTIAAVAGMLVLWVAPHRVEGHAEPVVSPVEGSCPP